MKRFSVLLIISGISLCLLTFLEVIHTPIYYGKRNLTLVDSKHVVAFKEEELLTLDSIQVSKVAYYSLKEMIEHAKREGVFLKLEKGYERMERTMSEYNLSSYNEHATGLAIDFASLTKESERWLEENAYRYGFILRYPKGKEKYTKVSANPFHYRYVGVMDATLMYKKGICLEEYLNI